MNNQQKPEVLKSRVELIGDWPYNAQAMMMLATAMVGVSMMVGPMATFVRFTIGGLMLTAALCFAIAMIVNWHDRHRQAKPQTQLVPTQSQDPVVLLRSVKEKKQKLLNKTKAGVGELHNTKTRLEQQQRTTQQRISQMEADIVRGTYETPEAVARAVAMQQELERDLDTLGKQHAATSSEHATMAQLAETVTAQMNRIDNKMVIAEAQKTGSNTSDNVRTFVKELNDEAVEMSLAVQQASEQIDHVQANTEAVRELVEAGSFDDLNDPLVDDIDRELARAGALGSKPQ